MRQVLNRKVSRIGRIRNWIAVRIGFVWKPDEPISIDRRCVK